MLILNYEICLKEIKIINEEKDLDQLIKFSINETLCTNNACFKLFGNHLRCL